MVQKYFDWISNKAPMGPVEIYPIVNEDYSSSRDGIFIIGDLTGVPLLKLASESGVKVWNSISRFSNRADVFDAIIIGAGVSGISAAIQAKKLGKKVLVLEANSPFQTVIGYPKHKPIFSEPKDYPTVSEVRIEDGTKESLLEDLNRILKKSKVDLRKEERVSEIASDLSGISRFNVKTTSGKQFFTENVIVAIGKSGDPRKLGVSGEELPNVFHRLFDPKDFEGQNVLVVGGGDTAVEASIAISQYAKSVSLSYRNSELTRPKSENVSKFSELVSQKKIQFVPNSNVRKITETEVLLEITEPKPNTKSSKPKTLSKDKSSSANSVKKLKTDGVLVLVGTEPPIPLLKKWGLAIQNTITLRDWFGFSALLSFAITAYFGKAAFYVDWYQVPALLGIAGFILFFSLWGIFFLKDKGFHIPKPWPLFRNSYLLLAGIYFFGVYVAAKYFQLQLFDKYPSFHYTLIYSLTIAVFGIRRMYVRKTEYIVWQTLSLITVQTLFLFLLPEIIFPYLGKNGYLGDANSFVMTQIFPNESYWKAYGFILAWPLNMGALYDGGITTFWLVYGLLLTFGLIPFLVIRYGKGAYCGWICSCGGLAETLGDEHRTKMPHGKFAYKIEHSGQWILLVATILTFLKLVGLGFVSDSVKWVYDLVVDVGLAGVVGVGCYFLFSGRIWCRMFCPLAGLMHIYAKWSSFRIFSEKKKCISCNICTKVCHQGIDVMSYANKGIPMDSVQCVRCSACVSNCPTGVLEFGRVTDLGDVRDTLEAKTVV